MENPSNVINDIRNKIFLLNDDIEQLENSMHVSSSNLNSEESYVTPLSDALSELYQRIHNIKLNVIGLSQIDCDMDIIKRNQSNLYNVMIELNNQSFNEKKESPNSQLESLNTSIHRTPFSNNTRSLTELTCLESLGLSEATLKLLKNQQ